MSSKLFLEEVLNSFNIMIGCLLNLLNSVTIILRERSKNVVEELVLRFYISYGLWILCHDFLLEEEFEPFELDVDSVSDESQLAEVGSQLFYFICISAVDWRDGGQLGNWCSKGSVAPLEET
jgi:hypothetical protein